MVLGGVHPPSTPLIPTEKVRSRLPHHLVTCCILHTSHGAENEWWPAARTCCRHFGVADGKLWSGQGDQGVRKLWSGQGVRKVVDPSHPSVAPQSNSHPADWFVRFVWAIDFCLNGHGARSIRRACFLFCNMRSVVRLAYTYARKNMCDPVAARGSAQMT